MLTKQIKRKKEELDEIDPRLPDNRFKYANKKSELNVLYRKLEELTDGNDLIIEEKKNFKSFNNNKMPKAKSLVLKRLITHK